MKPYIDYLCILKFFINSLNMAYLVKILDSLDSPYIGSF